MNNHIIYLFSYSFQKYLSNTWENIIENDQNKSDKKNFHAYFKRIVAVIFYKYIQRISQPIINISTWLHNVCIIKWPWFYSIKCLCFTICSDRVIITYHIYYSSINDYIRVLIIRDYVRFLYMLYLFCFCDQLNLDRAFAIIYSIFLLMTLLLLRPHTTKIKSTYPVSSSRSGLILSFKSDQKTRQGKAK